MFTSFPSVSVSSVLPNTEVSYALVNFSSWSVFSTSFNLLDTPVELSYTFGSSASFTFGVYLNSSIDKNASSAIETLQNADFALISRPFLLVEYLETGNCVHFHKGTLFFMLVCELMSPSVMRQCHFTI